MSRSALQTWILSPAWRCTGTVSSPPPMRMSMPSKLHLSLKGPNVRGPSALAPSSVSGVTNAADGSSTRSLSERIVLDLPLAQLVGLTAQMRESRPIVSHHPAQRPGVGEGRLL